MIMPLTSQPNLHFYRKIRQEDATFASFSHIFLKGDKTRNGVLISSSNDLAIFKIHIYIWKTKMPGERTVTFSRKMNYSVIFRMHSLIFNFANSNSVFPACLAQLQEFNNHFWFSEGSIIRGCVPSFAHVWQNMEATQATDDLPPLSLRRIKTEEKYNRFLSQSKFSLDQKGCWSSPTVGSGCCCLLLSEDPNEDTTSQWKWLINNRHALAAASGIITREIMKQVWIFKNWNLFETHLSPLYMSPSHKKT